MIYHVEKVATSKPENREVLTLLRRLQAYRITHFDEAIRKAADVLIDALEHERLRGAAVQPHDQTEIALLQKLIAIRLNNHASNPLSVDIETAKAMVEIEQTLFQD